jgi:adenosine deaminase
MSAPIAYEKLQEWKEQVRSTIDPFLANIPKVELHVHIEGTMTPELRWKLAPRNNLPLRSKRMNKNFHSLEELKSAYNLLQPRSIKGANQVSAFFDAYYGGMEVLRVEEDFYDLAIEYFGRAAAMNVRDCEPLLDPQAHTRRGVSVTTLMTGLHRAQIEAEKNLKV